MDLRSHYPYWLLKHGIIHSYPSIEKDIKTDVAVIGAGITGALVAWHLHKAGIKTLVVDRRHIGMGSTAASTGLLQYEIDMPLHKLIGKVGKENAVRSYQLCLESIHKLQTICSGVQRITGYCRRPSFQYASYKKDIDSLKKEYALRKEAGISVDLLSAKDIRQKFGFRKEAGLFSADAAEVDAYGLTHALLKNCREMPVFDNTNIIDIIHHKKHVELVTREKKKIKAKKLVIACGYESQQYIPKKVQTLHSTYAIVSEPFTSNNLWYRDSLIWETAEPYLYMRTSGDGRVLIGGKDSPFTNPNKRDDMLATKAKQLEQSFLELFPHINLKTDFKWAGTFASTRDGLPYIGSIPQRSNTYFALGFGGNGITFSLIAAEMIRGEIKGHPNKDAPIFRFDR